MNHKLRKDESINVYTDGSCYPNTTPPSGKGGWAFVAKLDEHIVERYGHIPVSTNNISELTAIREALIFVKLTDHPLILWTDSKYCKKALTEWHHGWRLSGWVNSIGKAVANRELIEETLDLIEQHRGARRIEIRWTKGHAGNPLNERADVLAGMGRKLDGEKCIPWEEIK